MQNSLRQYNSRSAFSLLEVSIAMVLGAFLMLAIFQTFFVTARYRMLVGESQTRGIVLTNAIRDLSNDVLSLAKNRLDLRPNRSAEPVDLKLRSSMVQPTLNFRDSFALESKLEWVQFSGKRDYLAIRTRAWSARFTRLPTKVLASGESLVVWWLYRGSQPRIEGWLNQDLPVTKTLKLPPNPKGLIRTQFFIDRSGVEHEYSEVILPEAMSLQLRYFDGRELQENWEAKTETANSNPSPTAIEVRLKLEREEIEHWIHIPAN